MNLKMASLSAVGISGIVHPVMGYTLTILTKDLGAKILVCQVSNGTYEVEAL